jgi:FkbM family methyltransferase
MRNDVSDEHYEWARRTSWSQFGEDAVVQAFLRSEAYRKNGDPNLIQRDGFYVDVGAFHPFFLSNTYWLYEQGWRGVNVDATPDVMHAFDEEKPEDVNLNLAISDYDGEITFFSYGHSVLNTSEESEVDWSQNPTSHTVPCLTLKSLFDRYAPSDRDIDLLSVDVEGHDFKVISSNDWSKYRPNIVLIERHSNGITEIVDSDIFKFMKSKGYDLHAWTPPTLIFLRS